MPPRPKTAKLSQNPLKFRNKGDRPLIFPVNADTARKTTRLILNLMVNQL